MRTASLFVLLVALFAVGSSGCASFITRRFDDDRKPYPGVRADIESLKPGEEGSSAWWLLDLPFSALYDTLALPFDLMKK